MGMFDSIYLEVICPLCFHKNRMEIQTKATECRMNEWRKGDFIGTKKFKYVYGIGECRSFLCKQKPLHFVYFKVFIKDGIITGEYEIINKEEFRK